MNSFRILLHQVQDANPFKKECQDLGFREKESSIFSASSNSSELSWSGPNLSEMFSGWSCCRRFAQAHQSLKYLFLWIPSLYLWRNCCYLWKKLCKPFAHLQTLLAKGVWGFFVPSSYRYDTCPKLLRDLLQCLVSCCTRMLESWSLLL